MEEKKETYLEKIKRKKIEKLEITFLFHSVYIMFICDIFFFYKHLLMQSVCVFLF